MEKVTEAASTADIIHMAQEMTRVAVYSELVELFPRFAKQVLTRLENDGILTPQVRKHVLDGFNDARREAETRLNSIN